MEGGLIYHSRCMYVATHSIGVLFQCAFVIADIDMESSVKDMC